MAISALAWVGTLNRYKLGFYPVQAGRASAGWRPSMSASPEGRNLQATFFRIALPKEKQVAVGKRQAAVKNKTNPPKKPPSKPRAKDQRPRNKGQGLADVDIGTVARRATLPTLPRNLSPLGSAPEIAVSRALPAALKRPSPKPEAPAEAVETQVYGGVPVPRSDKGHHRVDELAYVPKVSLPSPGSVASNGAQSTGKGVVFNPAPSIHRRPWPPGRPAGW